MPVDALEHNTPNAAIPPSLLKELQQSAQQKADLEAANAIQADLQGRIDTGALDGQIALLFQNLRGQYRNHRLVDCKVMLENGQSIILHVPWFRLKRSKKNSHREKGIFPHLAVLGIFDGMTPELVSLVAKFAVAASSLEEARSLLADIGIKLDVKKVQKSVKAFALRARAGQINQGADINLSGLRVVISADGGRIRVRRNKKGPKTKKGRTRYDTSWREPKLIIIYVVAANGRLDRNFSPIIDGEISGPKATVSLIQGYLKGSQIEASNRVLFVGDGAKWLWNRISAIFSTLGISKVVVELLDFYHAVEHLTTIANQRTDWSQKQRKAWVRAVRKQLLDGQSQEAIAAIEEATKGDSKILRRERQYFRNHAQHLDYALAEVESLPRGSGAIESAIRRVVNLRLKGAGIFWHLDTANECLFLRSYYKSGRWGNVESWAISIYGLETMGYERAS